MAKRIAGIEIPDSRLATEATELVRAAAPPLLFDHSRSTSARCSMTSA
jgi:hypothetical protein